MRTLAALTLSMLLLFTLAPVAFAADYDTEDGQNVTLNKIETSLQPSEGARTTKAYSLTADYSSGSKRGDLRSRSVACRISDREESYGQYHVEMTKRGESAVTCGFGYRRGYYGSNVELRLYHKATVPDRCPISITVNGSTVVYDWSPRSTNWHTTSWNVASYLREGANEIVVRLGQAPKMYWLKRIEVSAGADCLFRDADQPIGPGPGPGPDYGIDYRRLYDEARRAYDDGVQFARRHDVPRARSAFGASIDKCRRIERGTHDGHLRRRAQDLRIQGERELSQLDHFAGDERWRRVFEDALQTFRRAQSLPLYDGIRLYKRVIRMCDDVAANARDRELRRRARDLRQRAWYALPAADRY